MISGSRSTMPTPQSDRRAQHPARPCLLRGRPRDPWRLFDRRYRRQRRGYDLLAAFHLDQEALAIDIAVGIELHIEQNAGMVLGADGCSMQHLGEFLGI